MSAAHTPVRSLRPELAADQVTEGLDALHAPGATLAATPEGALQARGARHPRHALLADTNALAGQHRVHPGAAIAALARPVERLDALQQPRVIERAI